jgi:CrcB protein
MLGGTLRYLVNLALPTQVGQIPWGTLAVNLAGAFVLALLLSGWVRRGHVAHPWRPFLATGILGSFTTWSALMADTYGLYAEGVPLLATTYLVGSTALGIGAAGVGWWTAQRVVPHVDDEAPA